jgi:phage terminase large subunit-like protein
MAIDKKEIDEILKTLSDDPEELAKDFVDLSAEEVFRKEEEQYKGYEPNGKCEEYIKAIGEGKYFGVLFSAANGVGKTAASANVVAHIIFGKESKNPYFNYPLYKDFPYPKRGRIVSSATNIEKNIIPALKEWFPLGRYTTSKAGKHFDSSWKTDNDWEFDIMTYEQDPMEFEGATLGWAWFDEPPTEAIFKATVSRMRKGGIIFISETPLTGSAWLYDHIVANPDKENGQWAYIEADVEAACKEHGIRGHLKHSNIEQMIAEYSEDEKQARIYGKFQHLIGLRFRTFSRAIHIIKPFMIDLNNFTVYHALDTHPRNPDAGTWIAVDKKGTKFIVDELYLKCQNGVEELSQRIKSKNDQYRIEKMILEPAAFVEDQHTGNSLARSLSSYGLNYFEASKIRNASDRRIDTALAYTQLNIGDKSEMIKAPEMYIFDTCQRTIFEFEHLRWDEWSGKIADNKDQKEKTIDKDDHILENIGRILIQEPSFVSPRVENQRDEERDFDPYS